LAAAGREVNGPPATLAQGLCDRVAAVSGTLAIDSRPGDGTVVRARLPIA
jgi:signal transduction histidine kinase